MHFPALVREVMAYLDPEAKDVILDATVGGGGHAAEILKKIVPEGKLIAVDRDLEAIERTRQRFIQYKQNIIYRCF